MKNSKYLQKGFTLIDVLLTVAIISLLSSVTFSHMSEARQKAEDAKKIGDTDQVKKAIYLSKDSKGTVPGALSVDRGQFYTETEPQYDQALGELVTDGYISEIPHSTSGNSYAYMITEDGQSAVFVSGLNNGSANNVNNSCDFVSASNEIEFTGSCTPEYGSYYISHIWVWNAPSCNTADYDPETEICVTLDSLENKCDCETSIDPNFPDSLCAYTAEYLYNPYGGDDFCVNRDEASETPQVEDDAVWICPFTQENGICNGTSDNEYCGCIE